MQRYIFGNKQEQYSINLLFFVCAHSCRNFPTVVSSHIKTVIFVGQTAITCRCDATGEDCWHLSWTQVNMVEKNNKPQLVNSESFMADKNYVMWLSDLKKLISSVGLRSIQVKSKLFTKLVNNYSKLIMPVLLSRKSCFVCLGDIKPLLPQFGITECFRISVKQRVVIFAWPIPVLWIYQEIYWLIVIIFACMINYCIFVALFRLQKETFLSYSQH